MLLRYPWLLSLATLAIAEDPKPWEINRQPRMFRPGPNGEPPGPQVDAGPVTYYLDPTCVAGQHDLRPVIEEVKLMGKEGFERLGRNDPDFAAGYARIFKVRPEENTDLRDQRVMRAFFRISGLTESPTFEAADIRIFCDNDESTDTMEERGEVVTQENQPRWIPCPDNWFPPGPQGGPLRNGVPNSGLIFEEQIFMDQINLMYRAKGDAGVQDEEPDDAEFPGEKLAFAQWYGEPIPIAQTNQNPLRETITISDLCLGKGATLKAQVGTDIIKTQINTYDILQSHTLFHELCHSRHVLGDTESKNEIYGFDKIDALPADNAQTQGDSFAFIGLYALLNSRNIKLKDAPSSDLEPLNPAQPVTKAKRFQLISRRQTMDYDLSPSTNAMLRRRAIHFLS